LIAACTSAAKKEAEANANALALALKPPSAPHADDSGGIVRSPEDAVFKGVADQNVNRDANGQSLTVVVRVVQLRDRNEFTRLSFDAVTTRSDAELFPRELVAASEMVLMPGLTQEITDNLLPEAKYVGVIGYFRRPDAQSWRLLFDAGAVRKEGLVFVAQDCYLTAVTPLHVPMPGQAARYAPECTGIIPPRRSRR
jgi:type VI secretion system protein VasD